MQRRGLHSCEKGEMFLDQITGDSYDTIKQNLQIDESKGFNKFCFSIRKIEPQILREEAKNKN